MGNKILHEPQSDAANKYREELGAQFVYAAYDDNDYDTDDYSISFLDYLSLLQDEWARVNHEQR